LCVTEYRGGGGGEGVQSGGPHEARRGTDEGVCRHEETQAQEHRTSAGH